MKAVFLCELKDAMMRVFDESVVAKIRTLAELDETIYSKSDVLASPGKFADTEIVFSTWGMPVFSEKEIEDFLPNLKCIFYGAGTVQEFARPFLNRGVKVFSAWAANAVPVAEVTVAEIILAGKNIFTQTRLMEEKRIDEANKLKATSVGNYRHKVGIIGCGMIGTLVAKMLSVYSLDVCVFDPFLSEERAKELNVTRLSLDELFESCLVVSNHLADNADTRGMIKYSHFVSMPKYGTFINTGRGAQVVEEELIKALADRPDLTAVLDVTYKEPPELSSQLYTLPNCFLTPHIAGSQGKEVVRMAEYMAVEFEKYLGGEASPYEVTLKMLETMA